MDTMANNILSPAKTPNPIGVEASGSVWVFEVGCIDGCNDDVDIRMGIIVSCMVGWNEDDNVGLVDDFLELLDWFVG